MKKTLAAIGATAMGFAVVGAGAVAPAAAADTTVPCANLDEQFAATGSVTDNWFQDCVPQYGLGKAEFSIVADEDDPTAEFPAEFVPLDEVPTPDITTSSSSDVPRLVAYFDGTTLPTDTAIAPITPVDSDLSDPTTQTYFATVYAPVLTIGDVEDPTALPTDVATACDVPATTYPGIWVATFGAVDTTFSQTIAGEAWDYTITATPKPTYFMGTVDESGLGPVWCITDGTNTFTSADVPSDVPIGEYFWALVTHTPFNIVEGESSVFDLGTFARNQPAPPAPAPAELAATGVDATPLVFAAGAFATFGAAMLAFTSFAGRRRRARA